MSESSILRATGLYKSFREAHLNVDILKGVYLRVTAGERIAIIGSSGAGKSTLLHILGGLDQATSGMIAIDNQDISTLGPAALGELRNRALGFIYQFHHLLPEFTAVENVAMPLWIRRQDETAALATASEMLAKVGLEHRLQHKPGELSGGERQRVAVARAMVTRPLCVLADEPTGNLDRTNAEHVFNLMLELNRDLGTALIVVTHDPQLAGRMDRVLKLVDGLLQPA
jgi:lipoprotein-releasing system ATP-binding protein